MSGEITFENRSNQTLVREPMELRIEEVAEDGRAERLSILFKTESF